MYMQSQNVHGLPILSSVMTRVKKANWKDSNPVSYKYLQQWTTEAPSLNLISHAVCEASCQALSLSLSLLSRGKERERGRSMFAPYCELKHNDKYPWPPSLFKR